MTNYVLLISTLLQLIKQIETLMPDSPGVDKLNAVLAAVEGLFGQVQGLAPIVNTFVATLNASGVFGKKAAS